MRSFKDRNGKDWAVRITVASVAACRKDPGFDLLSVMDDKNAVLNLSHDPVALVGVLYAVLATDIKASNMTPEQFGEAVSDGDVIEAATFALLESIADFSPSHRRQPLMAAISKLRTIQAKAGQLATDRINSAELETAALANLTTLSGGGDGSGNTPASSV